MSNSSWAGFFMDISPEHRWLLLVITIGCSVGLITAVTAIVTSALRSMHKHRSETELKRELVERGMSADEIATIIRAVAPENGCCPKRTSTKA
jgi:hypothetical protein